MGGTCYDPSGNRLRNAVRWVEMFKLLEFKSNHSAHNEGWICLVMGRHPGVPYWGRTARGRAGFVSYFVCLRRGRAVDR